MNAQAAATVEDQQVRITTLREARLGAAYDFFDLDGNGAIDEREFLAIGQAMHPGGAWTAGIGRGPLGDGQGGH